MSSIVPAIGASGIYTLQAPFDALLTANVSYTCKAIRTLADYIADGKDPKADIYTANGLTDDQYATDLAANVCIVSLQSATGKYAYVPSSFIVKFPDAGGIPYKTIALAFSLSAIPDSLDLSYAQTAITEMILATLGINTTVKAIAISPETSISQTESAAAEAARQARITDNTTNYAKVIALQAENDSLRQQITQLENYIKAQHASSTGGTSTGP